MPPPTPAPVDVFISYSHLDMSWVTNFHRDLESDLGSLLGRRPVIWRDPHLPGTYFSDEIMAALQRSTVLLCVMSAGYMNSGWCRREREEFCRAASANGGLRPGNVPRLVKVVKNLVPEHPAELRDLLGFDFFEREQATEVPREFSQEEGASLKYHSKVYDVAYHLKGVLEALGKSGPPPAPEKQKTVYLAETTSDRSEDRDKITRELHERGYHVLPDKDLARGMPEYESLVRENLAQSRLSVHIVGERYGIVPEGAELSVVELQNQFAAEHCGTDTDFRRVIWIPEELKVSDVRQQRFIDRLRTDKQVQLGADLREKSLEDLKTRIKDVLALAPQGERRSLEEDLTYIYLIYDGLDADAAMHVRDYLFNKQYEVFLTETEGDGDQIFQYHRSNLLDCDAALIYYGLGNRFWFHSQSSELRKLAALGRTKPMLCKAVYMADPVTQHKQQFKTHEVLILPPGFQQSPASQPDLDHFIEAIENARAAQTKTGSGD
jgi:hypothetical protein